MLAFVSSDISSAFESVTGVKTLPLCFYSRIDTPVGTHADMLINIIEENVFCYEDYYRENRSIFDEAERLGYRIVKCAPPISKEYPLDIGLNALVIGKRIFGRVNYICKEIKKIALEGGYELIDVKQGYTACSTLVLDENNIITGDISIKKAAEKYGISVTLIDEKKIKLEGYGYGFIGGASFVNDGKIYVFGEAERLSSYDKIKAAADRLNMEIISILSGDVVDFGGVRPLKQ